MSISYKKITSMINDVVENDPKFNDYDRKSLKDICIDIYSIESSLDGGNSSIAIKESIKGKVSTKFAKVLKETE